MARKANADRVIDRYCDKPMARSKGFLPCTETECKTCIACIEIMSNGERGHYSTKERNSK